MELLDGDTCRSINWPSILHPLLKTAVEHLYYIRCATESRICDAHETSPAGRTSVYLVHFWHVVPWHILFNWYGSTQWTRQSCCNSGLSVFFSLKYHSSQLKPQYGHVVTFSAVAHDRHSRTDSSCRAMLCISAACAVMRCPSVRLSVPHVRGFCQNE